MFRSFLKLNTNFYRQNSNIDFYKYNKYLSHPTPTYYSSLINLNNRDFEKKFNIFLNNFSPIIDLKKNLIKIEDKEAYMKLNYHLENTRNNFGFNDILNLKQVVSSNINSIKFNDYNYYKYQLAKTDFLTAYIIIWNKNAETNLHYHPSNGCFILNIIGKWQETIHDLNKSYDRILLNDEINFINNKIGSHKVKYLPDEYNNFGISLNIYSPSCEIET